MSEYVPVLDNPKLACIVHEPFHYAAQAGLVGFLHELICVVEDLEAAVLAGKESLVACRLLSQSTVSILGQRPSHLSCQQEPGLGLR